MLGAGAFIAITPNTVEAFLDPNGTDWGVIRFLATTAFVVALLVWIFVYVREHRSTRAT